MPSLRSVPYLLPLLIFALWFGWMSRETRTRGGRVMIAPEGDSQLIVLGNSTARTDIDLRMLSDGMGGMTARTLRMPGSMAPSWYYYLRDRVYGAGEDPRIVIVASQPTSMLSARPPTEFQRGRLLEILTHLEEGDAERIYDSGPVGIAWARFRDRCSLMRRNLLMPRALMSVREAFEARLGETGDRKDTAFLQTGPPPRDLWEVQSVWPRQSYVPDLVDLVRENGAEPVFVLLPSRDRDPAERPRHVRYLERWMESHQVRLIDLRDLGWQDEHFTDREHLGAEGRAQLTSALVAALHGEEVVAPSEVVADVLAAEPTFAADPPTIAQEPITWKDEGNAGLIRVQPDTAYVSLRAAAEAADKWACSPVRVVRDGERLAGFPDRPGVRVRIADGDDRGGEFKAVLHPERRCDWWGHTASDSLKRALRNVTSGGQKGRKNGDVWSPPLPEDAQEEARAQLEQALEAARWLYPGDRATFEVTVPDGGADAIQIVAAPIGSVKGLDLDVTAGGETRRVSVPAPELVGRLIELELDPPVPAGPVSVQARSRGATDGFVYVLRLELAK